MNNSKISTSVTLAYMKFLYIIISVLSILSCSNPTQNKSEVDTISQQATDSIAPLPQNSKNNKWTNNFLELREAIITGDRETVKRFFDFPVISEGNEIWFLANSRLVMEMTPEDVKPFTETDFDRYFSSIFAVDLRQTLKQLNVEEFLKEHASVSPEIEVIEESKSRLEANYNESTRAIILKLVTIISTPSESVTAQPFFTYYEFVVTPDQKIKFNKVRTTL